MRQVSPPTPTSVEVAARLRMTVMRLSRRLRQQTEGDVTPSQQAALATVERLGSVTLGELSAAERVQPPTMTRIVAGLEHLGLVTRTVDESDRRVVRLRVTPQGHRLLVRSRTRKTAYLAARLHRLSEAELTCLDRAASILERVIEGDGA